MDDRGAGQGGRRVFRLRVFRGRCVARPSSRWLRPRCVLWLNPAGVAFAAPFIVLWWGSPIVARIISLPPKKPASEPLSQDDDAPAATRRTPGMAFLPDLRRSAGPLAAARQFPGDAAAGRGASQFADQFRPLPAVDRSPRGISAGSASPTWSERLESTLKTLRGLPRYRGHFYNWYDTTDLRPLDPRYVSAVDSGNLAGNLLVLAQACGEFATQPLFRPADLPGIGDSVVLLRDALLRVPCRTRARKRSACSKCAKHWHNSKSCWRSSPLRQFPWATRLRRLQAHAATLLDIADTLAQERGAAEFGDILAWSAAIQADITSHVRDLATCSRTNRKAACRCHACARPCAPLIPHRCGRSPMLLRDRSMRRGEPCSTQWTSVFCSIRTAQPVLDRLSRGRCGAGSELLRPAGVRSTADEPPCHRQGRHPGHALVPPRARACTGGRAARCCCPGQDRCSST